MLTPLEIEIRTVADLQGANLTEDAMKRVKERTQQLSATYEQNTRATSAVTEEMKRNAQEALRMMSSQEKAAQAAGDLHKNVNSLKLSFSGLKEIISGGLNGNILQVGEGIGKISKAAASATPGLQAFFTQLARGGAVGAIVAAPALVAIAALRKAAEENEREMSKIWDEVAKSRERTAAAIEASSARIVAAFEREQQAIERTSQAYEESRQRTESAYGRDEKLNPARRERRDAELNLAEATALKTATTPEARQAIKDRFERRRRTNSISDKLGDFTTAETRADISIDKASSAMSQAEQDRRNAGTIVSAAQSDFDQAMALSRAFKPTDNSAAAQAARDKAQTAKATLDKAREQFKGIDESTGKIISSAQAEIDAAKLVKEETAERRAAYKALLSLDKLTRGSGATAIADNKADDKALAAGGPLGGIRQGDPGAAPGTKIAGEITTSDGRKVVATAAPDGSGGSITMNGQTVQVGGDKTIAKLAETGQVLGKTLAAIEDFSTTVSKRAQRTEQVAKTLKESSAGG